MEKLVWKHIRGYEGLYQVSNTGLVKSIKSDLILSPGKVGYGYLAVGLSKKGSKPRSHYIHRLVAQEFIEKDDYRKNVNHKDGNKLNNHVDNLEWLTHQENIRHRDLNGLGPAQRIRVTNIETNEVNEFDSFKEAAAFLNVWDDRITRVLQKPNRTYKKIYKLERI